MTRATQQFLKLGTILVFGPLSFGCAQRFTIEPGLWRLDVQRTEFVEAGSRRVETPLDDVKTNVEVVLNWVKRNGEEVETVEIYSENPAYAPITGTIIEKPDPRFPERSILELRASGRSKEWDFSLFGSIKNPQRVEGSIFGREIFAGNRSFQGSWTLVKIED